MGQRAQTVHGVVVHVPRGAGLGTVVDADRQLHAVLRQASRRRRGHAGGTHRRRADPTQSQGTRNRFITGKSCGPISQEKCMWRRMHTQNARTASTFCQQSQIGRNGTTAFVQISNFMILIKHVNQIIVCACLPRLLYGGSSWRVHG